MNSQRLLINLTGFDSPGITYQSLKTLSSLDVKLIDIGQSILADQLTLSLLTEIDDDKQTDIKKEFLLLASNLNMHIDFQEIAINSSPHEKFHSYVLSCVAPKEITTNFLCDLSKALSSYQVNIKKIIKRSPSNLKALDLIATSTQKELDWPQIKNELIQISNKHEIDFAILKDDIWRRSKRLVVFDMDSTLIQSEVIVEMAKIHGVYDEVHKVTEMAMNGELDFAASLKKE